MWYSDFPQWWLFVTSGLTLLAATHVLSSSDRSVKRSTKRNARYLAEVSSLPVLFALYWLTGVPSTTNLVAWMSYEVITLAFFVVSALSDAILPLIIGIGGIL